MKGLIRAGRSTRHSDRSTPGSDTATPGDSSPAGESPSGDASSDPPDRARWRGNREDGDGDREDGDGDERGRAQSSLIGFLLLFGVLVMLVALLQVAAVPDWNRGVEVEHNERAIGDLQEVSGDIHQVAASGQARSSTVELGFRYPTRPFLINPTSPAGELRTTDAEPFELRNVDIQGVDNYWRAGDEAGVIDGTTRQLIYEPDYNEHEAAPRTVYENGLLYNEVEQRAVLAEESFVDGHRISLVALQGDVDRARPGSVTIPTRAESAPAQAVPVSSDDDGQPLELSIPTRLPESDWEDLLADEFDRNAGNIVGDESGVTVTDGVLTVTLRPGIEYDLSLARVAVDDQPDRTDPHYITDIRGGETPIGPGQSERLTFELRDELNNPKSGVDVEFEATDGDLSRTSATTGTDGQVVVRYTAPAETGEQSVTATADIEGEAAPTVNEQSTIDIEVVSGPIADPGDEPGTAPVTSAGTFLPANPGTAADQVAIAESDRVGTGADVIFRNQRSTSMTLREIRVSFYNTVGTQELPRSGQFSFGGATTTFNIPGNFVSVNGPTLAPQGQAGNQATVQFREFRNDPRNDFFVLHTVWEDGSGNTQVQSYLVNIRR